MVERRAHNPQVPGSKPGVANTPFFFCCSWHWCLFALRRLFRRFQCSKAPSKCCFADVDSRGARGGNAEDGQRATFLFESGRLHPLLRFGGQIVYLRGSKWSKRRIQGFNASKDLPFRCQSWLDKSHTKLATEAKPRSPSYLVLCTEDGPVLLPT